MIWQKFINVGGRPLTWISAAFRAMTRAPGSQNQSTRPIVAGPAQPFVNNYLNWPVKRSGRSFRVFVVEPGKYEPAHHAAIFNSAVRFLVAGEAEEVDVYQDAPRLPDPQQFDLVTFPEAFLPLDALLVALAGIPNIISDFGCVHVGLRCSSDGDSHLIPTPRLREFVAELKRIEGIEEEDLTGFSDWLAEQRQGSWFNIGCLFTLDAHGKRRICLHPKMVPSSDEVSALIENNMEEGYLLSAVTLRPTEKRYQTVTVQPLLCSDVLNLDTNRGQSKPLQAMHINADCLGPTPPDHVDVVSVPTCTPQTDRRTNDGNSYRTWHQQFRNTFVLASTDENYSRHHFAAFVLSNFFTIPNNRSGGLSGVFLPTPLCNVPLEYVTTSGYGRPTKGDKVDKAWSEPDDKASPDTWKTQGHLTYLKSENHGAGSAARLFGFTVERFLRHSSTWREPPWGLSAYTMKVGNFNDDFSALRFVG